MQKQNQIFKWLTPGDKLLISFFLFLSGLSFWLTRATAPPGKWVVVHVRGNEVVRLPFDENHRFEAIGPLGKTVISIFKGQVTIESSPCPHKLCMRMGPISRTGQLLVCVPNQIVILVQGNRTSFDFVTE